MYVPAKFITDGQTLTVATPYDPQTTQELAWDTTNGVVSLVVEVDEQNRTTRAFTAPQCTTQGCLGTAVGWLLATPFDAEAGHPACSTCVEHEQSRAQLAGTGGQVVVLPYSALPNLFADTDISEGVYLDKADGPDPLTTWSDTLCGDLAIYLTDQQWRTDAAAAMSEDDKVRNIVVISVGHLDDMAMLHLYEPLVDLAARLDEATVAFCGRVKGAPGTTNPMSRGAARLLAIR